MCRHLKDGDIDAAALRSARLSPAEVRQAVRAAGEGDLGDIALVILETNGKLSVIPRAKLGDASAIEGVPQ